MKLESQGDLIEQHYWILFIKDNFPSYEKFWSDFVVPLTNRPDNIHFKTNSELATIGKSEADICIAQLNYSIMKHLGRAFDILNTLKNSNGVDQLDLLMEGFAHLVGAQDNSFELLERYKNPTPYKPFLEKDGKKARENWKNNNSYPLQKIRDYRNTLLHGRLIPGIIDTNRLCLPDIDKISLYLDWRIITDSSNNPGLNKNDFISVLNILTDAWTNTVSYIENEWQML